MIIHPHAKVITITIATIIHRTGFSTGFHGRTAAVPSAMAGGLLSHSVTSGRTIIEDLSSSASAVTGPAIPTGGITGMGGTLSAGMAVFPRNM